MAHNFNRRLSAALVYPIQAPAVPAKFISRHVADLGRRLRQRFGTAAETETDEQLPDRPHTAPDTGAIATLSPVEVAEAYLPKNIIKKIAVFKAFEAKLFYMQHEHLQAQQPNEDILARIAEAIEQCDNCLKTNDRIYGANAEKVEWATRSADLEEARQSIQQQEAERQEAITSADMDLREEGQQLVTMIEAWLAELSGTTIAQLVPPVVSYDAPFDMALLETTEQRCAEQTRIDQEAEESLSKLESFIVPEDEEEYSWDYLTDDCLAYLKGAVAARNDKQESIKFLKDYRATLEFGGPVSDDQPEDFDLEGRLLELADELQESKNAVARIALWAQRIQLNISPEGEVKSNPDDSRNGWRPFAGMYEAEEDDEEDEEQLDLNNEKVESWQEEADLKIAPDEATPVSPTTPNPDLTEPEPKDSLTATMQPKPDYGYCTYRKQIDHWQAECERTRVQFAEGQKSTEVAASNGGSDTNMSGTSNFDGDLDSPEEFFEA